MASEARKAANLRIYATCETCDRDWEVDLPALAEKVPHEYSLINRRTRCQLSVGCAGWNVFWFEDSWYRGEQCDVEVRMRMPLFDRKTYLRWLTDPEG